MKLMVRGSNEESSNYPYTAVWLLTMASCFSFESFPPDPHPHYSKLQPPFSCAWVVVGVREPLKESTVLSVFSNLSGHTATPWWLPRKSFATRAACECVKKKKKIHTPQKRGNQKQNTNKIKRAVEKKMFALVVSLLVLWSRAKTDKTRTSLFSFQLLLYVRERGWERERMRVCLLIKYSACISKMFASQ